MDEKTLLAELATALHGVWCEQFPPCDSWDGANCETFYSGEMLDSARAVLDVVRPLLTPTGGES